MSAPDILRDPIRARLAELGWSQADLARKIAPKLAQGIQPQSAEQAVWRFLTAGMPSKEPVVVAILEALDLHVAPKPVTGPGFRGFLLG